MSCSVFCSASLPLFARPGQGLPVLCIGVGVRLVAIRLSGLREENQRRRVGGLEAEGEVEEDERVDVERREPHHVGRDPQPDDCRLADDERRRPEEAGKPLRLQAEPIPAEGRREVCVWGVKPEVMGNRGRIRSTRRRLHVHPFQLGVQTSPERAQPVRRQPGGSVTLRRVPRSRPMTRSSTTPVPTATQRLTCRRSARALCTCSST